MNAAARVIHQSNVFTGPWLSIRLSKGQRLLFTMVCALLVSAMMIIYVANESRFALSELERLEAQAHEYRLEWGQLLLEQAALSRLARVEKLATEKLGMQKPIDTHFFVLQLS